jgi:predicted permease
MAELLSNLRFAGRGLRKAPLFTAVAVVSIAVGIAANTAVFTLVDQVVLRRLPVADPGALVQVHAQGTEGYGGGMGDGTELSYAMFRDLQEHNQVFASMFCRFNFTLQVGHDGRSERVAAELVSGTFFSSLGVRPAVGRLLTTNDDRAAGAEAVAVLSYRYWQGRFGGDPAMVGRTISVNGHPIEIVGILDPAFQGLDLGQPAQLYLPITIQPQMGPPWLELDGRRFRWVQVFARLKDGMTAERAQAGLQPLYQSVLEQESKAAAFATASAETRRAFLDGKLAVADASRGHSGLRETVTTPLLILMAVACGVLIIVCANVANLLIARGAARFREMALRVAVGASRGQLVRLLLVESLLLAALGAGVGLVLATWGASFLLGFFTSSESPLAISADPDARIVLFTAGAAVLTAVIAGVVPAIRSTRVDLAPALKGSGGAVVAEQPRLRKTLVVVQVALSFLLLVGAGLFLRTLSNLTDIDPGFRTTRVLSFSVDLASGGYGAGRSHAFANSLLDRLRAIPSVDDAAYLFIPLLSGGAWGMGLTVEGYQPPPGEGAGSLINAVSPGFFKAMGIPVVAGREFDERDDRILPEPEGWPYRVAVVNEAFARTFFEGTNPVGRHIGIGDDPGTEMPIEIVGLVKDTRYMGIRQEMRAQVFFPYLQATELENVTAYVTTSDDSESTLQTIRRELAALDPQLPIFDVMPLDERAEQSIVNERLIASLSGALSAMATILSVVGLYGVMAYTVTRRTREIGIRMALGALSSQIARSVLREAAVLVVAGLVLGFAGAWWLGKYVESQLYGVTPADPATIAIAAVGLLGVAALAAALPARRAARVAPIRALRDE